MSRYRLGKMQIKRLLEGKPVMDGHGRKFLATENVKEILKRIDDSNLYSKVDVMVENGGLDIVFKEV